MNEKTGKPRSSKEMTRKGAERMAAIVECGSKILLQEGFAGLTKRQIARELNISHGNIGYYFPTREALWHAVIDHEIGKYYRRHRLSTDDEFDDPRQAFDAFVVRWIDEYNDRIVRIFFSHVIAHAEVNQAMASVRDDIYESFFQETWIRAKALQLPVDDDELERRVLEVMIVLEGLQAVSAFRPALVERDYAFKQRLLTRVTKIINGE